VPATLNGQAEPCPRDRWAGRQRRPCLFAAAGRLEYRRALALQRLMVEARHLKLVERDVLLILEHPAVFTLGRRGGRENLAVPESFLADRGIAVVHVERGGDITYHGPGQIVGYPIIDLRGTPLSVTDYVSALEEIMIRTAADFGVVAGRDPRNRGVWVGNRKLGSIGISIRRGISFHGFAFNVNLDLEPFSWINPCGLKGVGMTSLVKERGVPVAMAAARTVIIGHIRNVLKLNLISSTVEDMETLLKNGPCSRIHQNQSYDTCT